MTQDQTTYNVLMIAPTSFFLDYGCHVRIAEEAWILEKLGNKVTIVTYYKGGDLDGVTIERTRPIPWRHDYEVGCSRHKLAFDVLLSIKSLEVALRNKPDIIHAHLHEGALIGYVLGKLRGVPLVFDFQGSMTGEMMDHHFLNPDGALFGPLRWLEGVIDRLPQAIITSSRHAADLLRNEFHCHSDNIHIVPDCVNTDTFRPGVLTEEERRNLKAHLGIPPQRKVVVYLGLLAEYQGTPLLIQAAAQLVKARPGVHFLIMGFPGEEDYRAYAHRLGLAGHVTFTGKIPYQLAPRYLALGDVAVSTKISATEGSGKLLNYMALALPTVAFDTPVSREYLDEWGVYAEKGNPAALAEALGSILVDEQRATALGAGLRQRAIARYSWEGAGRQVLRIYDSLKRQQRI
ncbi:MAG: glycosyltransferase family 4 protein [Chloroflexi bacterium]|nr:glycosyltransferase family 4 protein [Chloroflexota bacterium]